MTKRYTLAIHYLDTDNLEKFSFPFKCLALDWFRSFCETNVRPVVITLYNSCSPCWVYHGYKTVL